MTRLIWSNDEPFARLPPFPAAEPPCPGIHALRAGASAPGFRLPNQQGRRVGLSAMLSDGPVVLRFCGHGGAAAYFREFDDLVDVNAEIERLGATLAAIAGQPLLPRPADRDLAAYAFLILTDKGETVARSYGLTCRTPAPGVSSAARGQDKPAARRGAILSAPATYIVDQDCTVALAVDPEDRTRLAADQIVMALECLNKRKQSGRPESPETRRP